MAKAKSSRKGKKEWRKNISTAEHTKFLERSGRDERSGGPLDSVPSASLFFVDKAKAASPKLRKVDLIRTKTLHSDSILKRASLVPPVSWKAPRPKKVFPAKPPSAQAPKPKKKGATKKELQDLWAEEDLGGLKVEGGQGQAQKRRRLSDHKEQPVVPAVEVDQPGCSYNPTFEDHQDALALAVAEEVVKEAKKELEPTAPPHEIVREGKLHALVTDLEMYAGLEALIPDEEARALALQAAAEEEAEAEEASEVAPGAPARPVRVQRLTRADMNRKIRRREQEAAQAAKLRRKKLLRDAERVGELAAEVQEEQNEVERRRLRKEVARKENRLEAPPRLGKHRFEAEPVNVMLTEELTGSLRQVKGCYTLARDRFKSLHKRGILEPRIPVKRRPAKRRRIVEVGSKGWKEREMHAEILQMRAARKGKGEVLSIE